MSSPNNEVNKEDVMPCPFMCETMIFSKNMSSDPNIINTHWFEVDNPTIEHRKGRCLIIRRNKGLNLPKTEESHPI